VTRAVVFGYHDVGVRCLKTLLAQGIDVTTVVTHADDPHENVWFESVADTADSYGIRVTKPEAGQLAQLAETLRSEAPDLIFSFYYRHMLPAAWLTMAPLGAFNMHGSLLPKYRGRVPVNWAVLHGETETGMTLHAMAQKPDAGDIIEQTAVPILPDDTAFDVFKKLTVAAEITLWRALPALVAGNATRRPNLIGEGSYFGGRKPEDGRIDWSRPRQAVYNLIRAVAPPYPGAFCTLGCNTLVIEAARLASETFPSMAPGLLVHDNHAFAVCGDGLALSLLRIQMAGAPLSTSALAALIQQKS
jgi:methionyl-tRNA formyltransferase